jgi:hypothetical protein
MYFCRYAWNAWCERFKAAICASDTLMPFGYLFSSSSARTVRPVSVVVAAISCTIVR